MRSSLLLSLVLVATAGAQSPEAGVSRGLAAARSARVRDLHYALTYTLKPHETTTEARETLTFTDTSTGDLAIDFRDGEVVSATLNEKPIATTEVNGHLRLPAALLARQNRLALSFRANVAAAGKAITRYDDKDDGNEYLYTLFVPMDASMAFPCFDQPDLKARFTLTVDHPTVWKVIGNTTAMRTTAAGPTSETVFAETRPISTYLFAFAAGPFERIGSLDAREPALFVRKSQLARAEQEAPAVQRITAQGIAYLTDYFAQPFPFPKYDLVLIPGFPFGGMEHAGATFLNEDGVLFRTTPTASDSFRRDTLVLHETTHQWFGDLVTMRWFDDLWLKEGFAQYMAYKALAALKPESQPWKHFYEDIKPLAYGIDETQGTTPIFQNIPNLKDAKSAYGAIVYQKAPAILKQLDYKLGDTAFRDGLRLYLKQHAYANATWPDLIHAFEQAGGKDVQAWADAWITRRGMPQVDVAFTCDRGGLRGLTLQQHDVLADGFVWPITSQLRLVYADASARRDETMRVDWKTRRHPVAEAAGKPCPAYVFANDGDFAYGRFLLDPASEAAVTAALAAGERRQSEALLLHSMLWGALWDNVRIARTAPRPYVELALKTLPSEADESLNRVQGGRIATSLHAYFGPQSKKALTAQAEDTVYDRMLHAPDLGVRIVNFRTFTAIASTPGAMERLESVLDERVLVPGMPLKRLDHWNVITHLIAENEPRVLDRLSNEKRLHQTGEDQKYAYAAEAAIARPEIKARYFDQYLHDAKVQEDWVTQSLRPFNATQQQTLTLPYLERALDALPEIKRNRKIFFLGAWLGAFIDGQTSPEAQTIVHAWLARKDIDADLRLKVLEVSDSLDRTVRIRKTFPEIPASPE